MSSRNMERAEFALGAPLARITVSQDEPRKWTIVFANGREVTVNAAQLQTRRGLSNAFTTQAARTIPPCEPRLWPARMQAILDAAVPQTLGPLERHLFDFIHTARPVGPQNPWQGMAPLNPLRASHLAWFRAGDGAIWFYAAAFGKHLDRANLDIPSVALNRLLAASGYKGIKIKLIIDGEAKERLLFRIPDDVQKRMVGTSAVQAIDESSIVDS